MTTSLNQKILAAARADIGTWEWAGDEHNPKVLAYYDEAGHPGIGNDEVPWCAAFVGAILVRCGVKPTGSLLARSYLEWGDPVSLDRTKAGDVVVIPRGSQPWQGHVFFAAQDYDGSGWIKGVGGNQGDQVNEKAFRFDSASVLGVRRARKERTSMAQSTTLQATGAGAAAAVGAGGTAVSQLDGNAQLVAVVGILIILAALGWIARERIKRWARGDR